MNTHALNPAFGVEKRVLSRAVSVTLMGLVGLSLLYLVGFAQGPGNLLHNAAHDTRHAFTFPCH